MPVVYDVRMPEVYYRWMEVFDWLNFDWDWLIIPGDCLPGGFVSRLLLRGVGPLVLMAAVVPLSCAFTVVAHKLQRKPGWPKLKQSLLNAVPFVLFVAFCLCTSGAHSVHALPPPALCTLLTAASALCVVQVRVRLLRHLRRLVVHRLSRRRRAADASAGLPQ